MALFGAGTKTEAPAPRKRRKFGAAALGNDDDESDGEGNFHPPGYHKWTSSRQKVWGWVSNEKTDWVLAAMILSSVVILIWDADLDAKGDQRTPYEETVSDVTSTISAIYTCIYAIEMLSRIYVFRAEVFQTAMLFDFLIVAADVLLLVAEAALGVRYGMGFLRIFRLARLFRFVRVVGMFPELQFLVKGFISSFSAVFWGSILMWVVILMWAIVAVYFIHPVNGDILERKAGTCDPEDRSCRAWSSVGASVITLCQTVVFGDSWGASAIEIIEERPHYIVIFAGMYATVTLGVLNLIVAAIVDSGAQAREEAQEAKRRRQRNEEQKQKERQKNRLLEICKILDDDESGSLSFDELLIGFERNTEFRNAMKDYNIDRKDLDVLFRVFDEQNTGLLDYQDFFSMIDSAREQASQQVLTFVRFAVMDLRQQVQEGQDKLKGELELIKEFIIDSENSLNEKLSRLSGETAPPKKTVASASKAVASRNAPPEKKPAPGTPNRAAPSRSVAGESPAGSMGPRGKADSRSASPVSATLKVPGDVKEKPAPLQQLLKINKEVLKGLKKLMDVHQIDFSPHAAPRLGSGENEVARFDSGFTKAGPSGISGISGISLSGISMTGSGEMDRGPLPTAEGQEQRAASRRSSAPPQEVAPDLPPDASSSSWLPSIPGFSRPKAPPPDERRTAI